MQARDFARAACKGFFYGNAPRIDAPREGLLVSKGHWGQRVTAHARGAGSRAGTPCQSLEALGTPTG